MRNNNNNYISKNSNSIFIILISLFIIVFVIVAYFMLSDSMFSEQSVDSSCKNGGCATECAENGGNILATSSRKLHNKILRLLKPFVKK